jgi:hypothetical protein
MYWFYGTLRSTDFLLVILRISSTKAVRCFNHPFHMLGTFAVSCGGHHRRIWRDLSNQNHSWICRPLLMACGHGIDGVRFRGYYDIRNLNISSMASTPGYL